MYEAQKKMMKRMLLFFIVLLAVTSCEEDVIYSSFRIEPNGFYLVNTVMDTNDLSTSFVDKFAGGNVVFTNDKRSYGFYTGNVSIAEYVFELPVGEYIINCLLDTASFYGQPGGSFFSLPQQIVLTDSTEAVSLEVDATCSLFLVNDPEDKLSDPPSMIQRYSYSPDYFQSFPMKKDNKTGVYYAYFSPDSIAENPTAYLWFYQGKAGVETGGLSTVDLNLGKIYQFEIHE